MYVARQPKQTVDDVPEQLVFTLVCVGNILEQKMVSNLLPARYSIAVSVFLQQDLFNHTEKLLTTLVRFGTMLIGLTVPAITEYSMTKTIHLMPEAHRTVSLVTQMNVEQKTDKQVSVEVTTLNCEEQGKTA